MTLDDLFSTAETEQDQIGGPWIVTVQAGVTTNQTAGLSGETNVSSVATGRLTYSSRQVIKSGKEAEVIPANFSGVVRGQMLNESNPSQIEWKFALSAQAFSPGYVINIIGPGWNTPYTARLLGQTGIIVGDGLLETEEIFRVVTLSICGLEAAQVPQ
jgi:hypothetical protein